MEKIALSETLSLSRLIYGMWRLGDDSDTSPAHVQAETIPTMTATRTPASSLTAV